MNIKSINVDIMLTYACNFRCVYCYEKDTPYIKDINSDVVKEFPNFILDLHNKFNKDIHIAFWGGEPTLRTDVILEITNELRKYSFVTFSIITNGYDIEKLKPILLDFKEKDEAKRFIVQVSYDFEPNQSINRLEAVTLNGSKAKEKVLENLIWLAENDVRVTWKSTISVITLSNIDKVYFDFLETKKLLQQYKPDFNSTLKVTIDTYQMPTDEEIKEIFSKFKEGMGRIIAYQYKNNITKDFNFTEPEKALCAVHVGGLAVDIDGSLYPCHGAVFTSNKDIHKLGSIFDYNINNLFVDKLYDNEECRKCYACFCMRCNIHCFDRSNKKDYADRMSDFPSNKNYCLLYKEISKLIYAKYELIKRKLFPNEEN